LEHYAVFRVSFLIFARNGMGLDLLKEARERRALARRTRQMGERLSEAAARARVNRYADLLEKRAAEREARAVEGRAWAPLVTHQPDSISRAEKPTQLLFGAGLMLRRLLGR
jgi:hypothetical protein